MGNMTELTTADLSRALSLSPRVIRKKAEQEGWSYRLQGGQAKWIVEKLPVQIRDLVYGQKTENAPALSATEKSRAIMLARQLLCQEYQLSGMKAEDFLSVYNTPGEFEHIKKYLGQLTRPTFYRWVKKWRVDPDSLCPYAQKRTNLFQSLSDEHKRFIETYYLDQRRWTIGHVYELMVKSMETSASYDTVRRYIQSLPRPLLDFYRLGKSKFDSLYQPYIERRPETYKVMEQVASDHHCFDFLVEKDGRIFRPWITAFQDFRSAMIVGYAPCIYPNSLSIMVAFWMMVTKYGAPQDLIMDNGKDYRSEILNGKTSKMTTLNELGIEEDVQVTIKGIFAACGVNARFTIPYHGQSKARIERSFGTFAEYFSKSMPTYVGSNTVTKPEDSKLFYRRIGVNSKKPVTVTWDYFVSALAGFVEWMNDEREHKGRSMDSRTPRHVFESCESLAKPVDPTVLALAFGKGETRRVRENGVNIRGVFYWNELLFSWSGRDVIVRVSMLNSEQAAITDEKGVYICTAVADWFVESGDLSADNERVNNARKANMKIINYLSEGGLKTLNGRTALMHKTSSQPLPEPDLKVVGLEDSQSQNQNMAIFDYEDSEPKTTRKLKDIFTEESDE